MNVFTLVLSCHHLMTIERALRICFIGICGSGFFMNRIDRDHRKPLIYTSHLAFTCWGLPVVLHVNCLLIEQSILALTRNGVYVFTIVLLSVLCRYIWFISRNLLSRRWPQACTIKTSLWILFNFPAAQHIWFRFVFCNLLRCRKLNRKFWQALKMSFILDNFARAISTYLIYLFSLLRPFVPWMSSAPVAVVVEAAPPLLPFHKSQCYRIKTKTIQRYSQFLLALLRATVATNNIWMAQPNGTHLNTKTQMHTEWKKNNGILATAV